MSTAATVLNGIRYDLRNYGDIDFDEPQMIHYLNRALYQLDYTLIQHNSDWTLNSDDVTLSTSDNYVDVPTGAINIREVWIGDDRLENLDAMALFYKREFISDTFQPRYWSHVADDIEFEVTADADYTVTVYYDKQSTSISASTDTMPYEGRFDNLLREATVLLLESKKYKNPSEADAAYLGVFDRLVYHDTINRKFVKKNYSLDF